MREKIMRMLSDMDDEQIKNVYDYVCDEYDEKNHEANRVELLKKIMKENEGYIERMNK